MQDEFKNKSAYPMITFQEAWERIEARLRPLPPVRVALARAGGLVLAEDVTAPDNVPDFAAATMDGYALIAADASPERRIMGEDAAGAAGAEALKPGQCRRIMTGAPLPSGADAVLPVELTRERDGVMITAVSVTAGANVRQRGSDVAAGAVVLGRGTLLGAAEMGLLASVGCASVKVHPRPRVFILATGDELVSPGQPLAPGQVYESNSFALAEAARSVDCLVERGNRAADSAEMISAALQAAVGGADLVLTSGGVSMGTRDLLKPILETLGEVHFGRVATRPGKPLTYATVAGVPVLALPGNPVSSLVGFEMYARPALRVLANKTPLWRPSVRARLLHAVKRDPERLDWQRARVSQCDGVWQAETTGAQASSRVLSLVGANGLLCIPPGEAPLAVGAEVDCILLERAESEESPW